MQRVQREITDVEMIDALEEIIDIIVDCYEHPVRDKNTKFRAAQSGYDIQRCLLRRGLIRTGGIENHG